MQFAVPVKPSKMQELQHLDKVFTANKYSKPFVDSVSK
jgi:hypothetical protein